MAEQSHLEAMREAIRGDLERARSRRPSIFERPAPPPLEVRAPTEQAPEPAPEPAAVEPVAVEPEPEPVSEPVSDEPEPLPEPAAVEPDPEPELQAPVEAEQPTPKPRPLQAALLALLSLESTRPLEPRPGSDPTLTPV